MRSILAEEGITCQAVQLYSPMDDSRIQKLLHNLPRYVAGGVVSGVVSSTVSAVLGMGMCTVM